MSFVTLPQQFGRLSMRLILAEELQDKHLDKQSFAA